MRIALVVHGLPPFSNTGVETYTAALAHALASAGDEIFIFAARPSGAEPHLAQRLERRGLVAINWLYLDAGASYYDERRDEDVSAAFGSFLDRVKPRVVHFQHIVKLGFGLPIEARERGLPTLYSAHDFYPLTDHLTLLRPDMRPFELGDSDTEMRCKVARRYLDTLDSNDHQGAVLPAELGETERALLATILDGDLDDAAIESDWVRAAQHEQEQTTRARARAFDAIDEIFAPSNFLVQALSRGPLADKVHHRQNGIDLSRFDNFERRNVDRDEERPLRFGFIGGITKHKGLHVLLDAFEPLAGSAELIVFGDSSDRSYRDAMRERCAEVGAQWRGGVEQKSLVNALRPIDALIVPSLWSENAPFVILEALAAKVPVIASNTPALDEALRSGEDGFLFEQGAVDELRAVLESCIADPDYLTKARARIRRVKGVHTEAIEWSETYKRVDWTEAYHRFGSSGSPTSESAVASLPTHVVGFAARIAAHEERSTEELVQRALQGLSELGRVLGAETTPAAMLPTVLTRGSRLKDEVMEARRERDWLRDQYADKAGEVDWRRSELEQRTKQLAWLKEQVETSAKELDWLRTSLADERSQRSERERELSDSTKLVTTLREECDWLKKTVDEREAECTGLREQALAATDAQTSAQEHTAAIEAELEQLVRHESWLRGEVAELMLAFSEGEAAAATGLEPDEIGESLERGRADLARITQELGWRRREMTEALAEVERPLGRFGVGRRVRGWKGGGEA